MEGKKYVHQTTEKKINIEKRYGMCEKKCKTQNRNHPKKGNLCQTAEKLQESYMHQKKGQNMWENTYVISKENVKSSKRERRKGKENEIGKRNLHAPRR